MVAAELGEIEIVMILVEQAAQIDARAEGNHTALFLLLRMDTKR